MAEDIQKKVIIEVETKTQNAERDLNSLKGGLQDVEQVADRATNGMISSFRKILKNPYLAGLSIALSALVAVFSKLRDAIRNSDDAGTAFARVLGILKAPLQLINRGFDALANTLGKVANAFADVLKNIMPKRWQEQAEAEEELVLATDRLEDAERKYAENHAKRESTISELERRARDSQNETASERLQALTEIERLRKQDYEEEKRIIQEKIRLWYLQNRNVKSASDEQKNILSQLNQDLISLNTRYNDNMRMVDRLSRTVTDNLIEEWTEVAKKHGDATTAIREYYAEVLKGNLQTYFDNLRTKAEEFYAAFFGEDGKKWKNYSFDARQNILSMYEAIKAGDETIIPRVRASYEELWKKYHLYTEEEIANADARTQANFQQMQLYEQILSIFNDIEVTTKKVDEQRIESEKRVAQAVRNGQKATKDGAKDATDYVSDRLNDMYEKYGGSYLALEIMQREYNEKVKNLQDERSSYEVALTKATTDREKGLYQNLIDEVNKEITEAGTDLVLRQNEIIRFAISGIDIQKSVIQNVANDFIQSDNNIVDAFQKNNQKLKDLVNERRKDFAKDLQDSIDDAAKEEEENQRVHENAIRIMKESAIQTLESFGSIAGSIADYYNQEYQKIVAGKEELTKQEKAQAVAALDRQKNATIAQIALQQAASIGNAILAASSAAAQFPLAAPVVYAAVATSILAGIVSSFMQAKQSLEGIDAQIEEVKNTPTKFSTGGYVEGAGTATSDSIPARLSNGEAVINARSTSMFYDLLSRINQAGGGVAFPNAQNSPILHFARGGVANNTQTIIDAIKTTINGVQPVVSVKEITRVQNRLKLKEI